MRVNSTASAIPVFPFVAVRLKCFVALRRQCLKGRRQGVPKIRYGHTDTGLPFCQTGGFLFVIPRPRHGGEGTHYNTITCGIQQETHKILYIFFEKYT
jgi:hypothetical protein